MGSAVAGLLLAAPSPPRALQLLLAPAAGRVEDPVLAVVALTAWALTAWLLSLVLLEAAARVPGRIGSAAVHAGRRVAPAVLRRALGLTLGAGLALSTAGPAVAASPTPSPATPTVTAGPPAPAADTLSGLDWPTPAPTQAANQASSQAPTRAPGRAGTSTGSPAPAHVPASASASARPAPTAHPAHRQTRGATVLVRRGDCLWNLARRSLGPRADNRAVAEAWPAWWSANRELIGEDPDLLLPGMQLRPPAS